MAALYGRIYGDAQRSESTRQAHHNLVVKAETWQGAVRIDLDKDGSFTVEVGDKHGNGQIAMSGNVGNDKERGRHIIGPDGRVYTPQSRDYITRFRPVRMTRKIQELYRTHVLS